MALGCGEVAGAELLFAPPHAVSAHANATAIVVRACGQRNA
jgi:hypothetical protein